MWVKVLLIIICIILNALFSASEIALVSLRKSHIKKLVEEKRKHAEILLHLRKHMANFFASLQIGITLVGMIAASLSSAIAIKKIKPLFQDISIPFISASSEALSIAISTFLITYIFIIFGELIPKSIAFASPENVGLSISPFVKVLFKILKGATDILVLTADLFLRPFGKKTSLDHSYITAEEIRLLVEEGSEEGIFKPEEKELIRSVFEFSDTYVKEVMVPLSHMVTIKLSAPLEEIKKLILEEKFSRYPVVGEDLNDIKGILYARDFFGTIIKNEPFELQKILRKPLFIPETMKISNLMRRMQKDRIHMAIVVDEYGSVSGLVTMEDLIEEIVGEIRDEYDLESPVIELKDGSLIVDASVSIADLKKYYNLDLEESADYKSIGGLLITILQRIPEKGDTVEVRGMRFKVLETEGTRILRIMIERIA